MGHNLQASRVLGCLAIVFLVLIRFENPELIYGLLNTPIRAVPLFLITNGKLALGLLCSLVGCLLAGALEWVIDEVRKDIGWK